MANNWRTQEKELYLPGRAPQRVKIPAFNFFSVEGSGNPNDPAFGNYIGVLYSLSYGIRMSHKSGIAPDGYEEYKVYPLEGVWDISETAKSKPQGKLDKDQLVFKLMIRQPGFVKKKFAGEIIEITKKKKPNDLLDEVKFEKIKEGDCVQMMHLGGYDSEDASFRQMERFCEENGLARISKVHREIYISDPTRTAPEKLKTVLRVQVNSQ